MYGILLLLLLLDGKHDFVGAQERQRPGRVVPGEEEVPHHLVPVTLQAPPQLLHPLRHRLVGGQPAKPHHPELGLPLVPHHDPFVHRGRRLLRPRVLGRQHELHGHFLALAGDVGDDGRGHGDLLGAGFGDDGGGHGDLLGADVLRLAEGADVVGKDHETAVRVAAELGGVVGDLSHHPRGVLPDLIVWASVDDFILGRLHRDLPQNETHLSVL
ncbi:unnamed protein product [Musa banksii]